jgi:hypothetical protein
MSETYEGWSNYETWNVKLWIDNDQGSASFWDAAAISAMKKSINDRKDATHKLAAQLRESHFDNIPKEVQGCYRDILTGNLQAVNWYEIACALIELNEPEEESESA